MSKYGRQWEHIRQIRDALRSQVPACPANTLADARLAVEEHCRQLRGLLLEWEALESDTQSECATPEKP